LALGDQLLPAAAGGRPRRNAAPLGRGRQQVSRFLRRHPYRLRGPLQSEDFQQGERAGQPAAAHFDALPTEHIVALAEKIAQITPGNLQQSFFTNSGTEANEAAILLARMSTGNFDVVALRHAYSGGSALAKAVTAHAPYRKAGVISVGISHAVNPYCYRCPLHLKYPDCEVACADDVENLIQTGTSGSIAAFIAEPIQGVGGFITPPKEYFKIVFKIVKKYGALFISDEVQTGWDARVRNGSASRIGKSFPT